MNTALTNVTDATIALNSIIAKLEKELELAKKRLRMYESGATLEEIAAASIES